MPEITVISKTAEWHANRRPAFIIIAGGIFSWWNRGRSGRDNGFKAMITPNDKWCSAVDDANKNRAGVTNVSYVVDGDTIKY